MGSKFRCMRSTPTETQSIRENDLECLASTGVNAPDKKVAKFEPSRRDHGCTTTFLLDAESARAAQFRELVTSPVAETLSAKDKTKPEIDSDP